jgi:Fe-S cluster biogenesis protein NfuA
MMSTLTSYTPLGKTCAEIASLVNMMGACQADAVVTSTLKAQLDAQLARLEAHLAAVRTAVASAPAALA